jgi:HAD superfamily phosphoserine phosphatase-like hydrolase
MTFHPVDFPIQIGAFFDLDGTLLPAPSLEWRFLAYLLAHNKISMANLGYWFGCCARKLLRDPHAATEANKAYLVGLPESLASGWASSLLPGSLPIFAGGLHRIRWHLARRHQIFFVSGTLEPLARTVASTVDRTMAHQVPSHIEVFATRLEVCDARWTGILAGEHQSGEAKARTIRVIAAERGLDLARCFAYGNAMADFPMLSAVGFPSAVNPTSRLERVARLRGWKIWNWKELAARPQSAPQLAPGQSLSRGGAR